MINKTLLTFSIVLVLIISFAFGQTIYRNTQIESLRTEIKDALSKSSDVNAAVAAMQVYEERIQYAYDHKPILNIDIGLSRSFAEQQSKVCGDIYRVMTNNNVIMDFLNNTNLEVGTKGEQLKQLKDIQSAARGFFLISGCGI